VQLYHYFVSQSSGFCCITLCVASWVFVVVIYFVTDSVWKLLDTPSYIILVQTYSLAIIQISVFVPSYYIQLLFLYPTTTGIQVTILVPVFHQTFVYSNWCHHLDYSSIHTFVKSQIWLLHTFIKVHPSTGAVILKPLINLQLRMASFYCIAMLLHTLTKLYEGVSKSFQTGHLELELQMVQLSAIRCNYITNFWVSLVSFAAITLSVASQQVFIVVIYFIIDSVRKLLDTPSYLQTAPFIFYYTVPQLFVALHTDWPLCIMLYSFEISESTETNYINT
jgi:hypothetical protein